jgi:hypothetical protein
MSITFKINTVDVGDYIIDAPEIPIIGRNRDYTMVATPISGLVLRKNYPYQLEINQEVEILVDNVGWFYGYISGWNYNYDSLQYEVTINNMLDKILLDNKTKVDYTTLQRYIIQELPYDSLNEIEFTGDDFWIYKCPLNQTKLQNNDLVYLTTNGKLPSLGNQYQYIFSDSIQYTVQIISEQEVGGFTNQTIKLYYKNVLMSFFGSQSGVHKLGFSNEYRFVQRDNQSRANVNLFWLLRSILFRYGVSIDTSNEKTLQVQISNTSDYLAKICIDESMLYVLNQQSAGDWSLYYTDERTANKPLIKDLFNLLLKTFSLILKYNGNKSYSLISELNYPTNVTDLYNINDNDKYSYFKSNVIKGERTKSYFNADSKRATNRESYYQSQVQSLSTIVFNKDNVYSLNSNNEIIRISNVSTLENIESFTWYNNLVFMLRDDLDYGDVVTGFLSVYFEFFTNELFDRVGLYNEELIITNLINTIYTVRELNLDLDSQTVTIKQEKAI